MSTHIRTIVEPMHIMLKRYDEIERTTSEVYRKPQHSLGTLDNVARAVADWDFSDPFAYGRTYLYAKQGYIEPADITKDYHLRTVARRAARAKEVDEAKK